MGVMSIRILTSFQLPSQLVYPNPGQVVDGNDQVGQLDQIVGIVVCDDDESRPEVLGAPASSILCGDYLVDGGGCCDLVTKQGGDNILPLFVAVPNAPVIVPGCHLGEVLLAASPSFCSCIVSSCRQAAALLSLAIEACGASELFSLDSRPMTRWQWARVVKLARI